MKGQHRYPTRGKDRAREIHRFGMLRVTMLKDCVLDVVEHLDLAFEDQAYAFNMLRIQTNELPSYRSQCLAGCTTTIVDGRPVTMKDKSSEEQVQVVCKIYHSEAMRKNNSE